MSQHKSHILVVDDDDRLRDLLKRYLAREGHDVTTAKDSAHARRLMQTMSFDLIVLDVMMPGEDGLSICRRVRAASRVPVIMLTAKGEDIDRIVGLEMGADDYLPKPFNPRELVARIRAILRRAEPPPAENRRFALAGLVVDLDARSVAREGQGNLELTSAEFDLLECFVTRPTRVLSREQLMDWTRGRRAEALDRTIDVQVSRLRKKIDGPRQVKLIHTVRGAGYVLKE